MMYEFKVGDVIHVTSKDEYNKLMKMLDEQGYRWASGRQLTKSLFSDEIRIRNIAYCIGEDKTVTWTGKDAVKDYLEFADIVEPDEPEITAVEAIRMQAEMCVAEGGCNECPLNRVNEPLPLGIRSCAHYCSVYPDKALKIIKEYHYKKTLRKDFEFAAQICEELGCSSAAAELRKMQKNINK